MIITIAIFSVICLLYLLLIGRFIYGWTKIPTYIATDKTPQTKISVIIAIRNEENNLHSLIQCLINQNYPSTLFEVILVNDHSTDNSLNIIIDACSRYPFLKHLDLDSNFGKKEAIKSATAISTGDLIVTTDADCTMNSLWLQTIASFYESYRPAMIIGPVKLKSETLFEKIQALEFLSLIGSGAGAAGINSAILCNGANLAYKKSILINQNDYLNMKLASGDDLFTMITLKKQKSKICFLKSPNAIVTTKPQDNLYGFIQQRLRWASKTSQLNDFQTLYTAIIVYLTNLAILVLIIGALFNSLLLFLFVGLFSVKIIIDFILFKKVIFFFNQQKLLWLIFPVEIGYFLYVSYIGLRSKSGSYKWKGRTLKQ